MKYSKDFRLGNINLEVFIALKDFPGGSESKECACHAGDPGLIPGLERFPGGGNDDPLQYSCQENPTDRGAWRVTGHGVAKNWTQLHTHTNYRRDQWVLL